MDDSDGDEIQVTLRVYGNGFDPDGLTELSGITPSSTSSRGGVSMWSLESEASPDASLDQHLVGLLERVEGSDGLKGHIAGGSHTVSVLCGLFFDEASETKTAELSSETLHRLGSLGIRLDLYWF